LHQAIGACLTAGIVGLSNTLAAPPEIVTSATNAEAMKAELACLADAKAFHLSLQFVTTANGVELRGQVPDEATRQHVLRLARQASYAVVHDRLTLVEHCADPTLRETARVTLARYMIDRDARVRVQVLEKGVVTEDKLIASRCLRAVPGCQRVVNHLEVKYPPAPTPDTVRHATTKASMPPAAAVRTVKADPEREDLPQEKKKDTQKEETEKKAPLSADARVYPAEAEGLVVPVAPNPVLPVQPVVQPSAVPIYHQPLEPRARPVVQSAVQGYATTQPLKPCGLPGYPGSDPAQDSKSAAVQLSVTRVNPPPTILGQLRNLIHGPRPERFDPEPVVAVPAVPEYRVMGNAGLPPVFRRLTSSFRESPPTTMGSTTASPTASITASTPVITVPASVPPTWPAAHGVGLPEGAAGRASTPTVHATPTVQTTHQAVTSDRGVPPLPVTPPSSPVLSPDQMRRVILQGCGKYCRDVKVTMRPNGQPVFNLYASVRAEQEVTNALLSIPEVAASNAHIQIHLEP
ncbi:MAG: BON domain-containing protein, partial [Gemmataceae bacterium]